MSSTKIVAPVPFTGAGPGGVVFKDGVCHTDNEAVIAYCRDAGYEVDGKRVTPPQDEPTDPRDLEVVTVGTRLRDAAVDPEPTDFLAPTNAGKADPHGPLVVAPGIHGIESQPVRPGQVFVDDLKKQDEAQTAQAQAMLVERKPVDEVQPRFERGDENGKGGSDTGPLGLSDPGSVVAVETGNAADAEDSTSPASKRRITRK